MGQMGRMNRAARFATRPINSESATMSTLRHAISVLLLALAVPCLGAPTITDPTDRQIVAAFLRHVDGSARDCTPERMAKFASQPEDITWQASLYIELPLVAYRLTGDGKYLDAFTTRMDALFACLTKGPDGFLGWYGLPLSLFRHPDHPDRKVDVIITSFTLARLAAEFAAIVQADPALAAKHGKAAARYLDIAEQHLVLKWDARGCYRELPDGGAVYTTHPDLKPVKAALTQPHNKHSKIIRSLLTLYAATGKDAYVIKAIRLGVRFKRCLRLVDGRYVWNYWDPAGPWDVNPEKKGEWKHWMGAEHRGGYYGLSLSQAVLLYEHGLLFDREDMDRFVKTQTTVCWNGDAARPQWKRVDGRGSDQVYLCSALSPFDERIYAMAYGPRAQAERLKGKDHSWQGSVVAMGWLEFKLLTWPRWKGGEPAEADVVAPFLAKPANRALLEKLTFDVTAPGYRPRLAP